MGKEETNVLIGLTRSLKLESFSKIPNDSTKTSQEKDERKSLCGGKDRQRCTFRALASYLEDDLKIDNLEFIM